MKSINIKNKENKLALDTILSRLPMMILNMFVINDCFDKYKDELFKRSSSPLDVKSFCLEHQNEIIDKRHPKTFPIIMNYLDIAAFYEATLNFKKYEMEDPRTFKIGANSPFTRLTLRHNQILRSRDLIYFLLCDVRYDTYKIIGDTMWLRHYHLAPRHAKLYSIGLEDYEIEASKLNDAFWDIDVEYIDNIFQEADCTYIDYESIRSLEKNNELHLTDSNLLNTLTNLIGRSKKIIVYLPNQFLYSFDYAQERKYFLTNDLVESVIAFSKNSSTNSSFIVLNTEKENKGKIRFIDANKFIVEDRITHFDLEMFEDKAFTDVGSKVVDVKDILTKDPAKVDLSVDSFAFYGTTIGEESILLKDVSETIFRGAEISSSTLSEMKEDNNEERIKLVTAKDIGPYLLNADKLEDISYSHFLEKYLLKDGDILLPSKFSTLKSSIYEEKEGVKAIALDSVIVIRLDDSNYYPLVLKQYIDSPYGRELLMKYASKRTINIITISNLKELPVPKYDKETTDTLNEEITTLMAKKLELEAELEEIESKYSRLGKHY